MITVEKILFLRDVSLFSGLDTHALTRIAEVAQETVYPKGSPIFELGEAGDSMYLIHDGRVRIHRGEEQLRELESPAYFGEMALLTEEPRSASATASTDCLTLRIGREDFRQILLSHPEAALDIIATLSSYLRQRETGPQQAS